MSSGDLQSYFLSSEILDTDKEPIIDPEDFANIFSRSMSFFSPSMTLPSNVSPVKSLSSPTQSTYSAAIQAPAFESVRNTPENLASNQLNDIEESILRASVPIEPVEASEIQVDKITGILLNKEEIDNWKGEFPIDSYPINQDSEPEVIVKKPEEPLEYVQELAVRYLQPPTPPVPGEIIITQEQNLSLPPAPPLIIRQQPPRPATPEPVVIREAPPQPPKGVGKKIITISGKQLPPPPRKTIIERLAPLPSKPQSVIAERWLPYTQVKRRVIYSKPVEEESIVIKPKNIIIQWQPPTVVIKRQVKHLGIIRANPAEYVKKYGSSLKQSRELPDYVNAISPPEGITLAADHKPKPYHYLEGEVNALRLVDLDKEGLSVYKSYLEKLNRNSALNSSSFLNTSLSSEYTINEDVFNTSQGRISESKLLDQSYRVIDALLQNDN